MFTSPETCQLLWSTSNIHLILFQQLQYISSIDSHHRLSDSSSASSTSSSVSLLSDLFTSCLSIYEHLLNSQHYDILLDKRNFNFIKLCVIILSSTSTSTGGDYHVYLSDFLLQCLLSDERVLKEYLSLGIIDGLFNLFLKFKQTSNPLGGSAGVVVGFGGGPCYTISLLDSILNKLFQLLKQNNDLKHVLIFQTNHFEIMSQLYSIICQELKRGSLRYSQELQELTDHLLLFFTEIMNGYGSLSSSSSSASLVFEFMKTEYLSLFENWNEVLTTSYQEGQLAIKRSIDMDIASGGTEEGNQFVIHPLLRNGVVSSNDLLVTAIPLWNRNSNGGGAQRSTVTVPLDITMDALRNGFSSLYQMDLILYYESDQASGSGNGSGPKGGRGGKTMTPLIQRREFDQLIEQTVSARQHPHPSTTGVLLPTTSITIYLNKNTASAFNTQQLPLTFHNSGLMNDHKNQMIFELKQTCDLIHKKIHLKLIEKFYDYFSVNSSANGEINKTQFISILLSLDAAVGASATTQGTPSSSSFTEQDGEFIFNAFDDDGNGMLSLHEICIGFSKLLSGTLDDKLHIIFYSYDLDRNHKLDLEELTSMIMISNHNTLSYEQSKEIAMAAGNRYDVNHDGVLDFKEFKEAYYAGYIPLGFHWSSSSNPSGSGTGTGFQRNNRHNGRNSGGNGSGSGFNSLNKNQQSGFSNLKKGFMSQNKPQIQTQFPQQQQQQQQQQQSHKSTPVSGMKKPLTLDALLQSQQQQRGQGQGQGHRGGKVTRHDIRRAFSLDADANAYDDEGDGPPEVPVLSRQAGEAAGRGTGPPIPKLTRGGGRAQDDSALHKGRKNQ
jgi:Ca2+-binding EF-hand superfamily protein